MLIAGASYVLRCSTVPELSLGPGSLSLLVFVWCPQLLQNWRYSGSAIDHSGNPAHQAKALGTGISLERFCLFVNIALLGVLSYVLAFGPHL